MSTDVVIHGGQTTLAIAETQTEFTSEQVAILTHLGVKDAGPADLKVFFHQVKRTGLDPFIRQIYMIGRWSKEGTKQTIQTGIDGYRLIGRRAATAAGDTLGVKAPQWAHEDGGWRDVWTPKWGDPVGARVTITRGGQAFEAVALFDEYKQTKRDGGLTQMWAQRPAGQIAKCAEALAWRMAFPQDLAGIYTDTEMEQASNDAPQQERPVASGVTILQEQAAQTIPADVIANTQKAIANGTTPDYIAWLIEQGAPGFIVEYVKEQTK